MLGRRFRERVRVVSVTRMTSFKAEGQLGEFLRRVLSADNDAAPADLIFEGAARTPEQHALAEQFASSLRDQGYIEPAGGDAAGGLARVRVTEQGREWLADYEQRTGRPGETTRRSEQTPT